MSDGPPHPGDPDDVAGRLHTERDALLARIAHLDEDMATFFDASRDSNADDEHDPEGQTIAYERSQLAAVTQQAREHLVEVDAALARVEDGTYGMCEVCGQEIAPGRLEARPTARACVQHTGGRARR